MSTVANRTGEVLPGLWRFVSIHPEWEVGEDWEPQVTWWVHAGPDGAVLIDPLVEDWEALDTLIAAAGGAVAAVVRLLHFHQRSVAEAAARYRAAVWARPAPPGVPEHPCERPLHDGAPITSTVSGHWLSRDDEIALWLEPQRALVFGDVMLRDGAGRLSVCPDSWLVRSGGPEPVRAELRELARRQPEHVLVSHGPLVLADGHELARVAAKGG